MFLVDDEEKRKQMGKRSRVLAEEKFDWSIIADTHLGLYEKMLENQNDRG